MLVYASHRLGKLLYALTETGERIACPHPAELAYARDVIGEHATEEELKHRTGIHVHCYCHECDTQVDLDLERDGPTCPQCGADAVSSIFELVESDCPQCQDGTIVSEDAGAIA